MSIHVTVNGNPVCIRRERILLSDLEQIKKYERARRRRLRLEQVRQQSKDISNKILQQSKSVARKELNQLENDEESELKRMHDEKILEIQRKYQEDMEDIGLAHDSAVVQPNVDAIRKAEKQKNQIAANERGKEATQRLNESMKADDPVARQQERLRQVREIEDIRSSMVANLAKKIFPTRPQNDNTPSNVVSASSLSSATAPPADSTVITHEESPKKRRCKKANGKKSPTKVILKPRIKVTTGHSHKSSPPRIHIQVDDRQSSKSNKTQSKVSSQPPPSILSNRTDKVSSKYNPNDYVQVVSGSSTSSTSSLISDDSSYFSDGSILAVATATTRATTPCKDCHLSSRPASKAQTHTARSKVKVYDHGTRHRGTYNPPDDLVERINIQNEPSAQDMARKILETESHTESNVIENQRLAAQRRGQDAVLRNKVRRDYENLVKNLDNLSREERKLNASRINHSNNVEKTRRQQMHDTRQRLMDRAYAAAVHNVYSDVASTQTGQQSQPAEAIITLEPRDELTNPPMRQSGQVSWGPSICEIKEILPDQEAQLSREEQILDMLKKVERQKRLLLMEFGSTLPNDVLSASMTPLFNDNNNQQQQQVSAVPKKSETTKSPQFSPEIKVINFSNCDTSSDAKKSPSKKKGNKTKTVISKKIETAVQTSKIHDDVHDNSKKKKEKEKEAKNDSGVAEDKSTQVELSPDMSKHISTSRISTSHSERHEHIEPVVTIITHGGMDSSSDTSDRGVIINVGRGKVEVTPRKHQQSLKGKHSKSRSFSSSSVISPVKQVSASIMTSTPSSPPDSPENNHDATDATSESSSSPSSSSSSSGESNGAVVPTRTINTKGASRVTKVIIDKSTDNSYTQSIIEAHETSSINVPHRLPKRRIEYKENSDASTSYASLPPGRLQLGYSGGNDISAILELVDSSANETIQRRRDDVSPVSTPGTPSSSIMRAPSNMPDAKRIARILALAANKIENQGSLISSMQHEETSGRREVIHQTTREQDNSGELCSCSNPICKLLYPNSDYIAYSHSDTLKRYDELQNVCTERIASLSALINRVRDEQRSMEYSVLAPSDDTSLMTMPPPRPAENNVYDVQHLVENIEAIHNQLARTLMESQRMMTNNALPNIEPANVNIESPITPKPGSDKSPKKSTPTKPKDLHAAKAKPKVISDEPVNIDLRRYKMYPAQPRATSSQKASNHENIVEKLSQEILEQSQKADKSAADKETRPRTTREFDSRRTPSPSPKRNANHSGEVKHHDYKPTREQSFIPVLADIPRNPKTLSSPPAGNNNGRHTPSTSQNRSVKEQHLSTIEEAATPETVNQSQGSAKRSPTGKCRKSLDGPSSANHVVSNNILNSQATNPQSSNISTGEYSATGQSSRNVGSPDGSTEARPLIKPSFISAYVKARKNGEDFHVDESVKSPDSFLIHYSASKIERDVFQRVNVSNTLKAYETKIKSEKITTSNSSNSLSGFSGISEILSTPSSDTAIMSPPEKMEDYLMGLGLAWLIPIARKTREASALSSSSNSDVTLTVTKRTKSPIKKLNEGNSSSWALPDFSDVSSISIREASKSTEKTVLMKARTSTPNMPNLYYASEKSSLTTTSTSGTSLQDHNDSIFVKNLSFHLKT